MKLERDKLYKLRNGAIVRVLALDVPGEDGPVAICYDKSSPRPCPAPGFIGRRKEDGKSTTFDIGEDIVSEHREPQEVWLLRKPGTNETRGTWACKHTAIDMKNRFYPGCEVIKMREVME